MYLVLLAPGNTEFKDAIRRKFPQTRSARLETVLTTLATIQTGLNTARVQALHNALTTWQTQDQKEFTNRAGTNGVFYRLAMELRQVSTNIYGMPLPGAVPIMPPDCTGDLVLGVYVPPGDSAEVCHLFSYRWLIAAGKVPESPNLKAGPGSLYNQLTVEGILFPLAVQTYPSARTNGTVHVQAGDLIGMFEGPALGHSMIAESTTTWVGANNIGTFALPAGRTKANIAANFGTASGGQPAGWIGTDNQWRRPDGAVVHVVYRRITPGMVSDGSTHLA